MYGRGGMRSQSGAAVVKDGFVLRQRDVIRVTGKLEPMAVYELIAEGVADEATRQRVQRYEEALRLYQSQRWDDAERILLELSREWPEDGACRTLLARIAHYRHDPPAADWDGVYVAKEK